MVQRDDLTEREFEVLVGIAAGETNREIAERLFITTETVRGYSKQIYSKLGVSNRTQAANVAREAGWLKATGLASAVETPHLEMRGLPTYDSSFVGRKQEILNLIALIDDPQVRLLTLIGPGGTGKTRLAVEVATRVRYQFPDGVCFVPLNETITDDETLLLEIQRSLGFNTASPAKLFERLRDKHLLILFDNFEQSLAQNHIVQKLLETVPNVMIMVTSQASLNLSGEWVRRIGNLISSDEENPSTFEDAQKLFVDRVRQVDPAFTMEANAECVAEICRIVNGMPLALELAAAWLKNLTCGDVLNELRHNLDILSVTADDLQTRHRGLEAVFEHTWNLLPEAEQRVYKRLSVFVGEFGLEAAQKVAGATLPTLASLVDWSLIFKTRTGLYHVHPLLRNYAEMKLTVRQHGKQSQVAFAVMSLMRGDFSRVESIAEDFLADSSDEKNQDRGFALAVMGVIAGAHENHEQCLQLCAASKLMTENNPVVVFFSNLGLAIGYVGIGDYAGAKVALHRAVISIQALQTMAFIPLLLPPTALVLAYGGQRESASVILGMVAEPKDMLPGWLAEWTSFRHLPAMLETEIGEARYAEQWAIGASLAPQNAIAYITGWNNAD